VRLAETQIGAACPIGTGRARPRHGGDANREAIRMTNSPGRLLAKAANRAIGRLLPPRLLARPYDGIPGRVHADDAMLRSEAPEHLAHYASDAQSAIANIEDSLERVGRRWADVDAFLDLPCGYGRVTRFLVQQLEPGRVTACDVDRQGVRFCAAEFGVHGIVAERDPFRTRFPRRYDVAFVGSLLTHLPEAACDTMLRSVVATLAPSGLLIFSTQGESCLDHLDWYGSAFARLEPEYRSALADDGICSVPYSLGNDYGVTLHAKKHVEQTMHRVFGPRLTLIRFVERGWDNHQDVWSYRLEQPDSA
jgi:SAM-dependent methyltransferase